MAGKKTDPQAIALGRITFAKRTNSERLDLSNLGLTSFPHEIGELTFLRSFSLAHNQLTALPDWIGDLTSLTQLYLGNNQLDALPEAIGRLTDLTELDLGGNQLTSLPEVIGGLTDLTRLDLDRNRFMTLPEWLGDLAALTTLMLHQNRLDTLPKSLGNLTALEDLYLDYNQLTALPEWLTRLRNLEMLTIEGNPLDATLLAKANEGTAALMAYLRVLGGERARRKKRGLLPHFEAKLVLVGPGKVGKTCLLKAILGIVPQEDEPTTYDIEIARKQLSLPHPENPRANILLNCWDFGGQDVYEITHQCFFSQRSIYLVLWDPRDGLPKANETIQHWVHIIKQRVGETARILIVCTHAQSTQYSRAIEKDALRERFGDVIVDFIEIDSLVPGDSEPGDRFGISEIKNAISRIAAGWESSFLDKYRAARTHFIDTARDGTPWITVAEFISQASSREFGLNKKQAHELAYLMDVQGHIINHGGTAHRNARPSDIVILRPEWLAKAIGKVLRDKKTEIDSGVLRHDRLGEIWETCNVPENLHSYLLNLMERFDISYRMEPGDQSLVPQLVKSERPRLPWEPKDALEDDHFQLGLVLRFKHPPKGLFPAIIVRTHRYRKDPTLHWENGTFLRDETHGTAIIEAREKDLWIYVRAEFPEYLLYNLSDIVERLIADTWKGIKREARSGYQLFVPCFLHDEDDTLCTGVDRLWVVRKAERTQSAPILCNECGEPREPAKLLRGFDSLETTAHERGGRHHGAYDESITKIMQRVEDIFSEVVSAREFGNKQRSQLSLGFRTVINGLTAERRNGPCLFTLIPEKKTIISEKLRLTLWCEYPDGPHPCVPIFSGKPGDHVIRRPPEWLAKSAPAISWMLKILKIAAPISTAFGTAIASELGLDDVKANLGLMENMLAQIPTGELDVGNRSGPDERIHTDEKFGDLGHDEIRVFQDFLRDALPDRNWAGLQYGEFKGEFLWLCPHHFDMYDASRQR